MAGAFGKFLHYREMACRLTSKWSQRANRDTLYSVGVFDLDAGPVTDHACPMQASAS